MENAGQTYTFSNGNALKFVRHNWVGLVFIAGVIVTWTSMQNSISDLEKQVAVVESRTTDNTTAIVSIQRSLAEINTTLSFIREAVSDK